jgi:formylglycine-generating enzyme required for sulfatase activity
VPVGAPPALGQLAPSRPWRAPADRRPPPLQAWAQVPPGTYRLGEPGEERDVGLTGVRIGRWPVVNAHVRAFVQDTGRPVGSPALAARLDAPQLADHPATEVTFDDVVAFCAWAGARLPTGDEWEAAARSRDGRPWPWGEVFDPVRCACAEAAPGWTVPVRAHPDGAAPCGAEQLAGNVWEWVDDPPGADGWRSVRGGSYLDHAWGVRASRALPADPARATATTGFRIALDPITRPRRTP